MSYSKSLSVVCVVVVSLAVCVADASAQRRGGGSRGGGPSVGRSAPRGPIVGGPRGGYPGRYYGGGYLRPRYITPRIIGVYPYRPYYYRYRPGLTIGFYSGFGYGYPYSYGYPYGYYGYPYAYSPYGYGYPPASYMSAQPGVVYGGVRIEGAPKDAQVFVDGNYVGVAEDFDGPVRHLNLPAGAHQIEIRPADGAQPIAFDVNVQGGQTMSLHADVR